MDYPKIICKQDRIESNRSVYAEFVLGPFVPGQGVTVGNGLRRSLLSEVYGLGITVVDVVGASHEYSNLPNVRESVLDILSNLKEIVLRTDFVIQKPQVGYLHVKGPGRVLAADLKLPHCIQCVDPEQYIATVVSKEPLKLKFLICKGNTFVCQKSLSLRKKSFDKLAVLQRFKIGFNPLSCTDTFKKEKKLFKSFSKKYLTKKQDTSLFLFNKSFTDKTVSTTFAFDKRNSFVHTIDNSATFLYNRFKNLLHLKKTNENQIDNPSAENSLPYTSVSTSMQSSGNKAQRNVYTFLTKNNDLSKQYTTKPSILTTGSKTGHTRNCYKTNINKFLYKEKLATKYYRRGSLSLDQKLLYPLKRGLTFKGGFVPGLGLNKSLPLKKAQSESLKINRNVLKDNLSTFFCGGATINTKQKKFIRRNKNFSFPFSLRGISSKGAAVFGFTNTLKISYLKHRNLFQQNLVSKNIANRILKKTLFSSKKKKTPENVDLQSGFKEYTQVQNVFSVDSTFMPVTKVNFSIEIDTSYREPEKDRVFLEIWTNGSIQPREALSEAAKSLIKLILPFQGEQNISPFFLEKLQYCVKPQIIKGVKTLYGAKSWLELGLPQERGGSATITPDTFNLNIGKRVNVVRLSTLLSSNEIEFTDNHNEPAWARRTGDLEKLTTPDGFADSKTLLIENNHEMLETFYDLKPIQGDTKMYWTALKQPWIQSCSRNIYLNSPNLLQKVLDKRRRISKRINQANIFTLLRKKENPLGREMRRKENPLGREMRKKRKPFRPINNKKKKTL